MRTRALQVVTLAFAGTFLGGCGDTSVFDPTCQTRWGNVEYACLSDAALLREIARVDGQVFVGFKEAGSARGVDELGRSLTSEATSQATKRMLLGVGMTFTWQASTIPAVAGTIPLDRKLLALLRAHSNVDYIEPVTSGSFPGQ